MKGSTAVAGALAVLLAAGCSSPPPGTPETRDAPETRAAPAKPVAAEKKPEKPAGAVSSTRVNLGHVFALRPRVSTAFRPDDFRNAKLRLQDESYASIEEAARAVAEEALGITNRDPRKRGSGRGPQAPPRH